VVYDGVLVSDWGAVSDRVDRGRRVLDLTMPVPDAAGDGSLPRR